MATTFRTAAKYLTKIPYLFDFEINMKVIILIDCFIMVKFVFLKHMTTPTIYLIRYII